MGATFTAPESLAWHLNRARGRWTPGAKSGITPP